jgi:hypothetical protein
MKQLAAVQLVGNAAALWLGYYWLSVGEARAGLLVWSFAVALVTAVFFLWLHGAGLIHGRSPHASPFAAALRHLPALLVAAMLLLLFYILLGRLEQLCNDPSFKFASWMTLKLRKPIKPATILRCVSVFFWFLRWIVIPILLMPWLRNIAINSFAGFKPAHAPRTWLDRLLTPVLLLCALWLPLRILAWRPIMSNFALEMTSFIIRALIAYLLFAGGLLFLEGLPTLLARKHAVAA